MDIDRGLKDSSLTSRLVDVGPVEVVVAVAAGPLLLGLAFLRLNLLVAALGELGTVVLVEAPLGAKLGARRGLAVNETERVVVGVGRQREGVVGGEVEDGVGGVLVVGSARLVVVNVAGPIGDPTQLLGAREGSEGDVLREGVRGGGCGLRRAPSVGIEGNST